MNKRETKPNQRKFLRLYFKQLFYRNIYVRYINPFSFWRRYRINHLETCCQQDRVQYLERCYQLKRSPEPVSQRKEVNCESEISFKQSSLNTTLIVRPITKLKYRSIIYQTRKFIVISVNYDPFDTNSSNLDNCKHSLDLSSINTPETLGND